MNKQELYEKRKKIVYDIIQDDIYRPLKLKEFSYLLQIPARERRELEQILNELIAEGKISVTKKGKYTKLEKGLLRGTFHATSRGFGFVTAEGEEEDYFIPEQDTLDAMNHDVVLMQVTEVHARTGRRKEGKIIKILKRGQMHLVGVFQKSRNFGFVIPDDQKFGKDIFLPKEESKKLTDGSKVVVKIVHYGDADHKPEGKVVEVLGHADDPRVDVLSVIKSYDVPVEFPQDVMNEVKKIDDEVQKADMAGRMDIRNWQTVTIDGEDAKDLDDAITLAELMVKIGKAAGRRTVAAITEMGQPLGKAVGNSLEVIEAQWLFDTEPDRIQVLVHPQSILHSAVEFEDGSVIGQMGVPDMRIPISFAMAYPKRQKSSEPGPDFFGKASCLTFEKPDPEVFRCIKIAYEAIKAGGTYPAVMNAANEVLVGLFLDGRIRFTQISSTIEKILDVHKAEYNIELEDILEADKRARTETFRLVDL